MTGPARRLLKTAVVLAAVAAAVALTVPLAPRALERLIEHRLSGLLGRPVAVTVADLDWHGLELAPVVVGEDARIERLRARWRLPELLEGRIEALAVSGAMVRLDAAAAGALIGGGAAEGGGTPLPRLSVEDAILVLALPGGDRAVPLRLDVVDGVVAATAELDGLLADGPLPARGARLVVAAAPRTGGVAGTVSVDGPVRADLAFDYAEGRLAVTAAEPLRADLERLPPQWAGALPPALLPALDGPLELSISGVGEQALRIDAVARDGGWRLSGGVAAALVVGDEHRAAIEAVGSAVLDGAGEPIRLDLDRATLDVTRLPLAGAELQGVLRITDLRAPLPAGEAQARLHVVGRDIGDEAATIAEAAASLAGRLRFDGPRLALSLDEPGRLWVAGLRLGGGTIATRAPSEFVVTPGPALELDLGAGGPTLHPAITAAGAADLTVADEALSAVLPALTVGGTLTFPDGPFLPTVSVLGAELNSTALGLNARGVDARLAHGDGPLGSLRIDALRRRVGGREGMPLSAEGRLAADGELLRFTLRLQDAAESVVIAVEGSHDPASGAGEAAVVLEPVRFAAGGLQPSVLFPLLAREIEAAAGTLSANGRFRWTQDRLRPDLKLVVEDFSGSLGGVEVQRLNTALRLDGLSPLSSPPDQILAVGLIDAGLPLIDNRMTFSLDRGRLRIDAARGRLAGGRVSLGPTVFDPGAKSRRMVLTVAEVDLSRLVEMTKLDGLSATGTLTGTIPVVISGDVVAIDDAHLVSTVPGVLRYRPSEPPTGLLAASQSMELVLKALNDFRYNELSMTLNGRAGGDLVATLRILGSNPDLYGGYPIEFNLNVTGKLDSILDDALAGYQIPDRIRERMMEFGAR